MKIKLVKGRPMLDWVGKRPIDTITNYPAQLVETYNVENPEKEATYERFKDAPNLLLHGDYKEILSRLLVQGFRGKIDLKVWHKYVLIFVSALWEYTYE